MTRRARAAAAASPAKVAEYAAACVRAVERSLGLRLDYAPDTIPLLDHYVDRLPDRPRARTADPVRGLVATMAGAYFGEVVRRLFPSRWVVADEDPAEWRLEYEYCFLTFHPVGVAWEVILRRDVPGHSAAYLVDEPTRVQIAERLDRLPAATIDDYYTFAQRLETLVLMTGWLVERVQRQGGRRRVVPPERYAAFLGKLRTPR